MKAQSPQANRAPKISELDGFIPERRDLSWDARTETLNDAFFIDQYLFLLQQIYVLVETSFFIGSKKNPKNVSPWSMPTVDGDTTFERYAAAVARPDSLCKNPWDRLLQQREEAQHFLTAVMNKMLHEHAFKTLLFGASDEQLKTLQAQDDALINEEGYRRTRLRAEYVDMYLKGTAPPLFWKQVDELAITVTRAFIPVLTWVRKTWTKPAPSLRKVHQQVHDLVSFAAWLAVCMRRSASIIEFDWPTPGERDLPSDNITNFDEEVYQAALRRVDFVNRLEGHSRPRHARVMVAIAPSAWRYTVYREGYRKVRLQSKRAVFYHGLRGDAEEKKDLKFELSEWASMQREKQSGQAKRRATKIRRRFWGDSVHGVNVVGFAI
ncbi:hypothetical protein ACHAQA_000518 [Verticillium albo-atrum]